MRFIEGFYIRVLWLMYATRLRPLPGLCPPACKEMHTYRWPCRARIGKVRKKRRDRYAYYDEPIGRIYKVEEDEEGIKMVGVLNEPPDFRLTSASIGLGGQMTYYQTDPPSSPNIGDVWFIPGISNEKRAMWTGTAWVALEEP